jgi:hypothetical protein
MPVDLRVGVPGMADTEDHVVTPGSAPTRVGTGVPPGVGEFSSVYGSYPLPQNRSPLGEGGRSGVPCHQYDPPGGSAPVSYRSPLARGGPSGVQYHQCFPRGWCPCIR